MSQYTLTAFGKKHQVSKKVFLWLIIPYLALMLTYLWCMFGGTWRFGENYLGSGWISIILATIIFGSISINDVHYGLLPENKFNKTVTKIVSWSAVIYYLYTVFYIY